MKAAQINEYGDATAINVVEADKPSVSEGNVLVQVYAASLNPWDSAVRSGGASSFMPLTFPVTVGGDMYGEVVTVGEGVTGLSVGDKVYGTAGVPSGSGAFAEFATANPGNLAIAPANLSATDIASLPMVGVSALQALTEYLHLQSGQKILIQGGGGGIGSVAVQIAKSLGAYVAATANTASVGLVKELGADQVIDYTNEDFTKTISDYDAVFDTVGGETFTKSLSVLKAGGIAGTMIANIDNIEVPDGITVVRTDSQATTERLTKLCKLIEQGIVTPRVGKIFPLEETKEAFIARESGSVAGKIVLEVSKK